MRTSRSEQDKMGSDKARQEVHRTRREMSRTSRFPGGWNQELGMVGEISAMFYILPTPILKKSFVTDKTAPVEHPYKQDYCEAFLFSLTISKSNKPEKKR